MAGQGRMVTSKTKSAVGSKWGRVMMRSRFRVHLARPAVKRMCRRAGTVGPISALVYEEIRCIVKEYVKAVVKNAVAISECTFKSTISIDNMRLALKWEGSTIYGGGK
eukprot:TRINITY_DN4499_c0_g1_i1.p1 TRINITY_DN4499_c0_g1~~TRINITY_DN4499_c0_g1_i1.p1  ORF type:complete len:108 (+),score=14.67 TRINITY_DN4499_c0_g1_i1:81-404(+)